MKGFHFFITTGVVYNGKKQTCIFRQKQSFTDLWNKMGGSYQIDVIGTLCLKIQKNFGQAPACQGKPGFTMGNRLVLTENAAHTTATEKNGTGTGLPGDTGLFPEMESCPRSTDLGALATDTNLSCYAVDLAGSGA